MRGGCRPCRRPADGVVGAGALLYADGRLYWHGETSGEVALIEANPETFRQVGRFTPPGMPSSRPLVRW